MSREYTVSQLNNYIKGLINDDYMLSALTVTGEVSNCKYSTKGHIYFTLKDSASCVSCVMFAGSAKSLRFRLKDGDKVLCKGSLDVYPATGAYQIIVRGIEQAGLGDLNQKFLELKEELNDMGMFDESYKQPIPSFVQKIGVATASTGAAIHDIIMVSKRRNPYVQIVLSPTQVQGEGAKESIIHSIEALDELGLDVIIVGRGGGSIEDLWSFNEKDVAMAIFNAKTPIVSAVGHETDVTIADFVADKRAATPSQAAEICNFVYSDFALKLDGFANKYETVINRQLDIKKQKSLSYAKQLRLLLPTNNIETQKKNLLGYYKRLNKAIDYRLMDTKKELHLYPDQLNKGITHKIDASYKALKLLATSLEGLSPLKRLNDGFGYIETESGQRVSSVKDVSKGQRIVTSMSDGSFVSTVEDITCKSIQ